MPSWHPAVKNVHLSNIRGWRKEWRAAWPDIKAFLKRLRAEEYDLVIDAQGLAKSALITRVSKAKKRTGLGWRSAREPIANLAYQKRYYVPKGQHAITRTRQLFAQALGYSCPTDPPVFNLKTAWQPAHKQLLFFHGTTWATKHYPEAAWKALVSLAHEAGYIVRLAWGNDIERERAERLAADQSHVIVLPKMSLDQLKDELCQSMGVISVDSGLSHLTAACGVPAVTLYASTDPNLTGATGDFQTHIMAKYSCAPCFKRACPLIANEPKETEPPCWVTVNAGSVWNKLQSQIITGLKEQPSQTKLPLLESHLSLA